MKSTLIEDTEIKYPCLRKSRVNGSVILFIDRSTGTIVNKGKSACYLGEYSDSWIDSEDKDFWEIYNGQVVLEN